MRQSLRQHFHHPLRLSLRAIISTSIASASLVFSLSVNADDTIEEVVVTGNVTGEFRDTNVLKLGSSVSLIDQKNIEQRDAKNLEDVLNLAPNVNYASGASRGRYIQIRGIGERSQFVAPINPSVGVIVDGIDFTGIATGLTTVDTQQIEIFRGPQGTLYGANALAGMINAVGNRPTDSFYGKASIGGGNYNSFDAGLILSAPIGDSVGWRFASLKNKSDGYIKNDFVERKDTNGIDELSLRNHFAFNLNANNQLDLISYYVDIDNGYDAFSLDNNRHTLSDQPGKDQQETLANALQYTYSGWSFADLKALGSYANSKIKYGYDEDWSYQAICDNDSGCQWPYSTTDQYNRDNSNASIDLRLVSRDTGQLVNWATGIYYRDQNVDLERIYADNFDATTELYYSDYHTKNIAAYGEIDLALGSSFSLITGLRAESFSAKFEDSQQAEFDPSETLWGGKLALEYTLNKNTLFYGLISRGYKPGGFNPDPDLEDTLKTFATESMINYELGSKGSWFNNSLRGQYSIFYQQRNDIQVKQSRAYPSDSGFTFTDFLGNANSGNNYGVEAETALDLTRFVTLFASLGLLETEYKDFINYSHVDRNTDTGEGYDMSQRPQAHAPAYQYLAGVQVNPTEQLNIRVEFEGKDSFYFSNSHNEQSQSFNLLNLRLAYEVRGVAVALWGRNLSNELVETRGFYFSHEFGNDPRKGYAPEPYTQKGAPRTYGASLSVEF